MIWLDIRQNVRPDNPALPDIRPNTNRYPLSSANQIIKKPIHYAPRDSPGMMEWQILNVHHILIDLTILIEEIYKKSRQ